MLQVLTPSTYLRFARIMGFGANRIPTGSPRQRVSFGVCNVIIPRMIWLSATWRCVSRWYLVLNRQIKINYNCANL
ncbi:hypothetical protein Hanom_Chr16g01513441 [Helianthus anomalus]